MSYDPPVDDSQLCDYIWDTLAQVRLDNKLNDVLVPINIYSLKNLVPPHVLDLRGVRYFLRSNGTIVVKTSEGSRMTRTGGSYDQEIEITFSRRTEDGYTYYDTSAYSRRDNAPF